MRHVRVLVVAAAIALVLVGCGSSSKSNDEPVVGAGGTSQTTADHGHAAAMCEPSGTSLSITAKDLKYDKDCLAAPADKPFTIDFDNKDDGIPHDVTLLVSHTSPETLFKGDTVTGPKKTTYKVGPLKAGVYHFHCSVHPDQMNGDFVVK